MSRTTLPLHVALLSALVLSLTSASPASAAPPVCGPGPLELIKGGSTETVASRDHVQGYVLRRRLGSGASCVVPGATVQLLARTVGSSAFSVIRTASTDDDGRVQFRVRPPFSTVLKAQASADGFAATTSGPVQVSVGTRLTINRRTIDRCRVAVSGSTYPTKPGTPVEVTRQVSANEFARAGSFTARSDGRYAGVVRLPCGSSVACLKFIYA